MKPLMLFVLLCPVLLAAPVAAQLGGITTYIDDPAPATKGTTYDISDAVLDTGYTVEVGEGGIIRVDSKGVLFYILLSRAPDGAIGIAHGRLDELNAGGPPADVVTLREGETELIDLANGGYSHFIEMRVLEGARIAMKTVTPAPQLAVGKTLFDIAVDVNNDKVQSARDLTANIQFVNFGEGPTSVDVTYSIKDAEGKEYYRGADSKVVFTHESVVKEFGFLSLPPGMYTFTGYIVYGQNQSASSSKAFTVAREPPYFLLFTVLAVGGIASATVYLRRQKK